MRLDGLDPMLAWGMGSTTGHTLIAMRDKTGQLVIAESTTNSSYWPTNGIQATPFPIWIKQAQAAGAIPTPFQRHFNADLRCVPRWLQGIKSSTCLSSPKRQPNSTPRLLGLFLSPNVTWTMDLLPCLLGGSTPSRGTTLVCLLTPPRRIPSASAGL
jgi:hypothetical protein